MDSVILENVTKIFESSKKKEKLHFTKNNSESENKGKFVALDNISLSVSEGEI